MLRYFHTDLKVSHPVLISLVPVYTHPCLQGTELIFLLVESSLPANPPPLTRALTQAEGSYFPHLQAAPMITKCLIVEPVKVHP